MFLLVPLRHTSSVCPLLNDPSTGLIESLGAPGVSSEELRVRTLYAGVETFIFRLLNSRET